MQVIDDLLAFQCCIRNRFSIVVNAGSVDAVEVGGYADRNFRFLSRRMEVSDKIYSRSQFQISMPISCCFHTEISEKGSAWPDERRRA